MYKTVLSKSPACLAVIFVVLSQLYVLCCNAQYYEEKPEPEFGIGIKVLKASIRYGDKLLYSTDLKSLSLQALVRYDAPLRISSYSPYQHRYMSFVIESGFLFSKAIVFDTVLTDPNTNISSRERSRNNPNYLPVYVGLYNRSAFTIGTSLFYWKGLGVRDLWGAKLLSLGYNGKNFRLNIAGEWYAQTKNRKSNKLFFSVDFLWKLIVDD